MKTHSIPISNVKYTNYLNQKYIFVQKKKKNKVDKLDFLICQIMTLFRIDKKRLQIAVNIFRLVFNKRFSYKMF